ncbi:hypothetical protein [uncultured Lacinutrix sp.]|uniref:hypothetical protein n=1 Tax=uncultured Lacinutrix sp. TaxID=574032 RepID=UPI00261F9B03|nr:hypothetical protein [uncultured Lacinutrix sp.]
MKKSITLLILSIFYISCNNEPLDTGLTNSDQDEIIEIPENILIIKEINDGSYDYIFDADGKLERINRVPTTCCYDFAYRYEYTDDNKLNREVTAIVSEEAHIVITYNNDTIDSYTSFGFIYNNPYSITIENNIITRSLNESVFKYTYASNNLKKITNYTYIENSITKTNISYTYDNNNNLTGAEEVIINGNTTNTIYTFTYDDKKNPIAESMDSNKLVYTLIKGYSPNDLIRLSPNNIVSNSKTQESFIYEYNTDNYPINAIKNNSTDNSLINTLTYNYY